jgi:hypothetical protein
MESIDEGNVWFSGRVGGLDATWTHVEDWRLAMGGVRRDGNCDGNGGSWLVLVGGRGIPRL